MIPATWDPYYRLDDGELIGYLIPADGGLVVPATIFGHPLDDAMDTFAAEQTLEDVGLSYLADAWWFRHDDAPDQKVVLVEASPEHLVVANADFALVVGAPRDIGDRIVLTVPTDRLRRA